MGNYTNMGEERISMEYLGVVAFVLVLSYSGYLKRVKKLERQVKELKRSIKGESAMSKLISELKGKVCLIKDEDENAILTIGSSSIECNVIDVDDEWIKISYKDKKDIIKTKIMRIESIGSIELIE
jgi:hypothetical protein